MSENEKAEQIGKLAEEYSHLKGELNHIVEKLNAFQVCCGFLSNPPVFQSLRVENGQLRYNPPQYGQQQRQSLDVLLSHSEVIKLLEEKQRLTSELQSLAERLKALAPHLL